MTTIDELDRWNRKFYHFTIQADGNNYHPGNGLSITLKGGGRTVAVADYQLATGDDDKPTHWPDLHELVTEALRRWHADNTPKRFLILYTTLHEHHAPGRHETNTAKYTANNEEEAKDMLKQTCNDNGQPEPAVVQLWEMNENWMHHHH